MAEKTTAAKIATDETPESSLANEDKQPEQAADSQPASEATPASAPSMLRVRADGIFVADGIRHAIAAGTEFLSNTFNLDLLLRQGIRLDVVDEASGEVLMPLD